MALPYNPVFQAVRPSRATQVGQPHEKLAALAAALSGAQHPPEEGGGTPGSQGFPQPGGGAAFRPADILHAGGNDDAAAHAYALHHPGLMRGNATGVPGYVMPALSSMVEHRVPVGSRGIGYSEPIRRLRGLVDALGGSAAHGITPGPNLNY